MKKIYIKISIIVIISFLCLVIIGGLNFFDYMFNPISVNLIEMAQIKSDEKCSTQYWHMINDNKNPLIKEYNIPISQIDFNKYNLIFSTGSKISKMTYTRASKYQTDYRDPYIGDETYGKEYDPYKIYVYKVIKIELISYEEAFFP